MNTFNIFSIPLYSSHHFGKHMLEMATEWYQWCKLFITGEVCLLVPPVITGNKIACEVLTMNNKYRNGQNVKLVNKITVTMVRAKSLSFGVWISQFYRNQYIVNAIFNLVRFSRNVSCQITSLPCWDVDKVLGVILLVSSTFVYVFNKVNMDANNI